MNNLINSETIRYHSIIFLRYVKLGYFGYQSKQIKYLKFEIIDHFDNIVYFEPFIFRCYWHNLSTSPIQF